MSKGYRKGNVNQSAVTAAYKQGMRGVDLLNHAWSALRPVIQGKKWYWLLVIQVLNIIFVYSWRVFRIISEEPLPQKSYSQIIVGILIRRAQPEIISLCAQVLQRISKFQNSFRWSWTLPNQLPCKKMCSMWKKK